MTETIRVGVGPLSFDDVVAVARADARVELTDEALAAIDRSRVVVEATRCSRARPRCCPSLRESTSARTEPGLRLVRVGDG